MLVPALCCGRSRGALCGAMRPARTASIALSSIYSARPIGVLHSARAGTVDVLTKLFQREVDQMTCNSTGRPFQRTQHLCAGEACCTICPVESTTSNRADKTRRLIFCPMCTCSGRHAFSCFAAAREYLSPACLLPPAVARKKRCRSAYAPAASKRDPYGLSYGTGRYVRDAAPRATCENSCV